MNGPLVIRTGERSFSVHPLSQQKENFLIGAEGGTQIPRYLAIFLLILQVFTQEMRFLENAASQLSLTLVPTVSWCQKYANMTWLARPKTIIGYFSIKCVSAPCR